MAATAASTDEEQVGEVLDRMYALVSGPAGPRDWSRQLDIFHPACRQIRTGIDADGRPWKREFTPEQYRADADAFFATRDFYEIELRREILVFGNIAHAWSLYEARATPDDAVPERRGINSIQLYREETGDWRVINMIWDNERPGLDLGRFLAG